MNAPLVADLCALTGLGSVMVCTLRVGAARDRRALGLGLIAVGLMLALL
ncbi:MAG: hypothetical protein JXJ18_07335 [Rhodobacteraceae bacterium]|nr:hypothetical protein [Paracoccaceae bacterium]